MKKYVIFVIFAALVLAFLFFPSSDEAGEIEKVLDEALEAGKKKDLEGLLDHFSINYRDEYGATYPVVKNTVKTLFGKFDSFDGQYSGLRVSIDETDDGERLASANFDVYVSGIESGIPSPILGEYDSPDNVTATLKKSAIGGWKIIKVEGLNQADGQF